MINEKLKHSTFSYFRIPLETGSRILTLQRLNAHSIFRRPRRPYLSVNVRLLSFRREVLTIGVGIADEMEERVLIRVRETELWVSCTVDTDEHYLSRYAYFGLEELMWFREQYDFEKYYWPGFFDKRSGKTKYLTIINDRKGLDILLKPRYSAFYKPGHSLPEFNSRRDSLGARKQVGSLGTVNLNSKYAVGYILADTNMRSLHSPHFPFLTPFYGISTKANDHIRLFSEYLNEDDSKPFLEYSKSQVMLNQVCFRMKKLAHLDVDGNPDSVAENLRGEELFNLWQKVISISTTQLYTYYCFTYGLKNVKGKPRKKWLRECQFRLEIPKLLVKVFDRGDYFEIRLMFKIGNRIFTPHPLNTAFFISSKQNPLTFYLLESYDDYKIVTHFSKVGFKMCILREHFTDDLKQFFYEMNG